MPPSSHENDSPSPRKASWWNPNSGSWRSPWSLDDSGVNHRPRKEAHAPPKQWHPSLIATPRVPTVVHTPAAAAITAKPQQPAAPPKQERKIEPAAAPTVPAARVTDDDGAPPQSTEEPALVESPTPAPELPVDNPVRRQSAEPALGMQVPQIDEQAGRSETPMPPESPLPSLPRLEQPAVPAAEPPADASPARVVSAVKDRPAPAPEPVMQPAGEAPIFRPRRVQPPKAQPPPDLRLPPVEAAKPTVDATIPPPSDIAFKAESAEPPLEKKRTLALRQFEPDFERDLPPQIGEWPPRRAERTIQTNPWLRLMVLSLAGFAFTLVTWVYWQDDSPPAEETLQLKRDFDASSKQPARERMRVLLASVAPVQSAGLVSVPPSHWEGPELARMVEANGVARENLRDLLEEPDWHPRNKSWFEEDLGVHGAWTSLTILKQAEAAYLMRRGEEEAAFTAAIDLAELARSLQQLDAWPSYYDRSLQILERASQTLVDLLSTTKLNSVRLGAFQDEFERCEPSDPVLRDAMSAWYLFEKKLMLGPESLEAIDTLPVGIFYERPGRLFFKPNRTLRLFALSFYDLRDEAEKSPYERSSQIALRLGRMGSGFGLPNSAGEAYFDGRIAPYVSLPDRQSIARAQHAVVTTLFALRRFHADYRRLPPKLLNLKPDFLQELPVDPFSGVVLEYEFATGVVASVGTNFTHDGGKPAEPPLSDPREIAARMKAEP